MSPGEWGAAVKEDAQVSSLSSWLMPDSRRDSGLGFGDENKEVCLFGQGEFEEPVGHLSRNVYCSQNSSCL